MLGMIDFHPFKIVLLRLLLHVMPPRNNGLCRVAVGGLPGVEHVGIQSEHVHVGFLIETGNTAEGQSRVQHSSMGDSNLGVGIVVGCVNVGQTQNLISSQWNKKVSLEMSDSIVSEILHNWMIGSLGLVCSDATKLSEQILETVLVILGVAKTVAMVRFGSSAQLRQIIC